MLKANINIKLFNFLKKNKLQIFRFIYAGSFASLINLIIFNLTYIYLKNILFSSFTGYFSGLLFSFIAAKLWVFKDNSRQHVKKTFYIFSFIYILGAIEMSFVIKLINFLTNNHNLAWLFGAAVSSINNYLGTKFFVFKR